MPPFLTYSKFHSRQEAQELTKLLEASGIEFELNHDKDVLDKIYTGESMDPMFSVLIPEEKFEDVNAILLAEAQSQLTNINPDYYLFSFSDQELLEVISNRNEWNHFDQALAHKILSDRRIEIPQETIATDGQKYSPVRLQKKWLVSQYLLTLLLPYLGIIIGLATIFAYKTFKSGEKVKMYDDVTRQHAKIMFALGILRTIYFFLWPWLH